MFCILIARGTVVHLLFSLSLSLSLSLQWSHLRLHLPFIRDVMEALTVGRAVRLRFSFFVDPASALND